MSEVVIDHNSCTVCCECINVCRDDVLGIREGKVYVFTDCAYCEDCVDVCENNAIKVKHDFSRG